MITRQQASEYLVEEVKYLINRSTKLKVNVNGYRGTNEEQQMLFDDIKRSNKRIEALTILAEVGEEQ